MKQGETMELKDVLKQIQNEFNHSYDNESLSEEIAKVFDSINAELNYQKMFAKTEIRDRFREKYSAITYLEDKNLVIEILDVTPTESLRFTFYNDEIKFIILSYTNDMEHIWIDTTDFNEMESINITLDNPNEIYDKLWNRVKPYTLKSFWDFYIDYTDKTQDFDSYLKHLFMKLFLHLDNQKWLEEQEIEVSLYLDREIPSIVFSFEYEGCECCLEVVYYPHQYESDALAFFCFEPEQQAFTNDFFLYMKNAKQIWEKLIKLVSKQK